MLRVTQFVYPFTLEPHVVTMEQARRHTLAAHAARREALLQARADEKERRKRDALRRIAPGFEPQGAPLVPVKKTVAAPPSAQHILDITDDAPKEAMARDVMADLVAGLAALDSGPSLPGSSLTR
jgi:hypothetical protein